MSFHMQPEGDDSATPPTSTSKVRLVTFNVPEEESDAHPTDETSVVDALSPSRIHDEFRKKHMRRLAAAPNGAPKRKRKLSRMVQRLSVMSTPEEMGLDVDEPVDPNEILFKQQEEVVTDTREPYIWTNLLIIPYLGIENLYLLLGMLGGACYGFVPVSIYLIMGYLIDGLTQTTSNAPLSSSHAVNTAASVLQQSYFTSNVRIMALYMTGIAGFSFLTEIFQHFFYNLVDGRLGTKIRMAYFNALLDQEIAYFDIKKAGTLVSYINATTMFQDAFSDKLCELVRFITQATIGITLSVIIQWEMALIMIACSPVLVIVVFGNSYMMTFYMKRIIATTSEASAVAAEVISSMRTVKSMDGEKKEKKRHYNQLEKVHIWYIWKALTLGLVSGTISFLVWTGITLGFFYAGHLVIRGVITVGQMFQIFGMCYTSVNGILQAAMMLPYMSKSLPAITNVLKVIKRKPTIPIKGGEKPEKIRGHIVFKDVCFAYPARPSVQVLKKFNLEIKPGMSIALVGTSGSGKTTIISLLEKFYIPNSGQILLDGVDLKTIDPTWLHKHVGIVTQEPVLFAGTIRENLCYAIDGVREVTQQEIEQVAIAANIHDFIKSLPNGYDTVLGERGVSISGGQKQRIAIARVMLQNPSILLLDEATSALDTHSESLIQEALTKLMKGRTSIVIAHKLTTIFDLDLICVMHKGELKEKGTHQELMQIKDGYYSRLVRRHIALMGYFF
jgi:ATP-binding cassette subfamily B (MDR/TAP) protein 1